MKTLNRRSTDDRGKQMNVLQSINAPVAVFKQYRDIAIAQYGDSTKKQHHFRQALTEYLENHKTEFNKILSSYNRR